ncbi:MAG: ferritin-like domain-containing protein [Flavobacterium sp.]
MDNTKTMAAFNTLIVINNDRIEGYKTAEAEARETDLKMLFSDLMETSVQNRVALVAKVKRLGGTPDEGTRVTGKFFRVWMDVKSALSGNDRKTILDSCEYGEDVILEVYNKILMEDHQDCSSADLELLQKQYALLQLDHDKVKALRDVMANEKR